MKKKIFIISSVQILFIVGFYFLLSILISQDSWQSQLIKSFFFGLFYFFLFPVLYKVILKVKVPKEHTFAKDENLLFETQVYLISIAFPEKIHLKVTSKNIIYRIYSTDKVIALENIEKIRVKKLDFTIYYYSGNKQSEINFITNRAEEIFKSIPENIQLKKA